MQDFLLSYSILEHDLFIDNSILKARILQLVGKSYQNPEQLIERIYAINDTAFVAKIGNEIVGVLLFNYSNRTTFSVNGYPFVAIYNGYAVTDIRFRNQRVIQRLIEFSTKEFNSRINDNLTKLLLYAITSNPFALRAYRKVCEYMEPFENGSYTEFGAELVIKLKHQLGITIHEDSHPFKFTTSLPQRYSYFEQVNLANAPDSEKLFLQNLGVDESIGDRLIFFWGPANFLQRN